MGQGCAFGKSGRPPGRRQAVLTSTLSARGICPLPDFLPLKCDACEQIFCTDHIAYAQHDCTSAYKKVSMERRSNPASRTELLSFPSQGSEQFVTSLVTWAIPFGMCTESGGVPESQDLYLSAANFQPTLWRWVKWFGHLPALLSSLPRVCVRACRSCWVRNSKLFGGW